ncbi:MAG: sigma-E processing peptidase SpoIIGA [Oscillibacter sp.]|nr:sigma-E processing peptidase SpoIIGA [Oscillibacter sp.]
MTVVYIDEVFALNAAADGFLLLLTARLAGIAPRWGRYALAALAGGVYACGAALPGFWSGGAVKCAAGVGLALVAFGREERLGRLTVLFFAVSCAFAGCVLAMGSLSSGTGLWMDGGWTDGRWTDGGLTGGALMDGGLWTWGGGLGLLACAALGTYGVLAMVLRAAARRHTEARIVSVRVHVLGRTAELTALWDSGNGLREGGEPVLVISPTVLDLLFPPSAARLLTAERLRAPETLLEPLMRRYPALRPRLMPYRAVGVSSGLLLTVESGWVETGGVRRPGGRLALSPTELGSGFQALWGGEAA